MYDTCLWLMSRLECKKCTHVDDVASEIPCGQKYANGNIYAIMQNHLRIKSI